MSNKVNESKETNTTQQNKKKQEGIFTTTKTLDLGKFYFIHDQSLVGHPGLIVWKDDLANLYLAIKVGTSPNTHNFSFCRPIGNGIKNSYIYKRAFLGKRKDFSKRTLDDMFITDKELTRLKKDIDFYNPVLSPNIKRKDKRNFKRLYKN